MYPFTRFNPNENPGVDNFGMKGWGLIQVNAQNIGQWRLNATATSIFISLVWMGDLVAITLLIKTPDVQQDCALDVVIARLHKQLWKALVQLLPHLDAACERLQLQSVPNLRPHPPSIYRVHPSEENYAIMVDPRSSVWTLPGRCKRSSKLTKLDSASISTYLDRDQSTHLAVNCCRYMCLKNYPLRRGFQSLRS